MENGCDHTEGSLMGKCAICGGTVCSECHTYLFSEMICGIHQALEDESTWELVGFYTDLAALADIRYDLSDKEIPSIVVEGDEEAVELYVPIDEKEHAYAALHTGSAEETFCEECQIQYPPEMGACPVCGGGKRTE